MWRISHKLGCPGFELGFEFTTYSISGKIVYTCCANCHKKAEFRSNIVDEKQNETHSQIKET